MAKKFICLVRKDNLSYRKHEYKKSRSCLVTIWVL